MDMRAVCRSWERMSMRAAGVVERGGGRRQRAVYRRRRGEEGAGAMAGRPAVVSLPLPILPGWFGKPRGSVCQIGTRGGGGRLLTSRRGSNGIFERERGGGERVEEWTERLARSAEAVVEGGGWAAGAG